MHLQFLQQVLKQIILTIVIMIQIIVTGMAHDLVIIKMEYAQILSILLQITVDHI